MRAIDPSFGASIELDPIGRVVLEFEDAWRSGPPPLDRFRDRFGTGDAPRGLVELVKADLHHRFARGERPSAREYLDRYAELAAEGNRAVSLIYEEYCLRTKAGEAIDHAEFCRGYATWRNSLVWQLECHRNLSRAVEPADDGPRFPSVGDRFGEFELVDELGDGATARVFLARSPSLGGKPFALKVSPDRGGEPEILGQLDHPNIVPVFASVVDPATGFRGLCMAFRPGLALDGLIRCFRAQRRIPRHASELRALVDAKAGPRDDRDGAPPGWADFPDTGTYADAIAWVGLKIARALAHAHGRRFIHRDVKPENVLLNGRDGPQLIDFNLAHGPDLEGASRSAHRGGTLPYMAIEQLEAFRDATLWDQVDGRADVFSLGMVLRELLTLRQPARPSPYLDLPRELPEAVESMIDARRQRPTPIRRDNRRVPHALEAIVARCLAAAPEDRYASAAALAEDLDRFLARRPLQHARNRSRAEIALNGVRRRRTILAAVGLAAAVGIASFALAPRRERARPVIPPTRVTLMAVQRALDDEAKGQLDAADWMIEKVVKSPDAFTALDAALKDHPQSLALRLGLGRVCEGENRLDEADRIYREVLDRDPGRVQALVRRADIAKRHDRYADAIRFLKVVIAVAQGQSSGALHDKLPELWGHLAGAMIFLADKTYDDKKFDDALAQFGAVADEVRRIDPGRDVGSGHYRTLVLCREHFMAMAMLGQSRCYLDSARPERAVEVLREALDHAVGARKLQRDDQGLEANVRDSLTRALRAAGMSTATASR